MKIPKPRFELARVYGDGTKEVEIVPVTEIPLDATTGRRGFLATALTAAAVLGSIGQAYGKDPGGKTKEKSKSVIQKSDCGGLLAHTSEIGALTISPDGLTLVSGSKDQTLKLWDLLGGTLRKTLEGHTGSVLALAISRGSRTLASGGGDKTIKLWDLPGGTLRQTLEGHTESILALAISPDGRLASAGGDKTLKVWELPGGTVRQTLKGVTLSMLAFFIKVWDLPSGMLRQTLEDRPDWIHALAISRDGRTLASAGGDKTIKLWDLPEDTQRQSLEDNTTLPFFRERYRPASTLRQTLEGHTESVLALAISPDGRTLVSAGGDKTIKLWDLPGGTLRQTLEGHTESVLALAISPDGRTLASAGGDKTIKLWELPSGKFMTCLIDLAVTPSEVKGMTYQGQNTYGQPITYTLPCGSSIPPGAICTCNCVPGTYGSSSSEGRSSGYTYCSCNKVCVCIPVCQAHRLGHHDHIVQTMAEEILLTMGAQQFDYMQWAAGQADSSLQERISHVIAGIREGAKPNLNRWPSPKILEAYLDHADAVIALMAAQLLHHWTHHGLKLADDLEIRASKILEGGQAMDWRLQQKGATT